MRYFDVFISVDSTHEGPQIFAEVVVVDEKGVVNEERNPVYTTTWYSSEGEAWGDAVEWLWVNYKQLPITTSVS